MIEKLPYQTILCFSLVAPSNKEGKEGIFQRLLELVSRHDNENKLFADGKRTSDNELTELTYWNMPFANLYYKEVLTISDKTIDFLYEERSDQQVMLPNIYSFVGMLMLSVKTIEKISCGFGIHNVGCRLSIRNNTASYFYEKYSPLRVDYSRLLKYSLVPDNEIVFEIESRDDVYTLFNSFYQQYTSNNSVVNPHVTVVRNSFYQIYDRL
jgi:hypothetical protein